MTRRTTAAYVAALEYVNKEIIALKGRGIIIDFESAMRASLSIVAPDLPIYGCWFHFCQALRRMMASMKPLHTLIRTNQDAKYIFRKFQCLALLPYDKMNDAFVFLLREALNDFKFNEYAPFIAYFKSQWMEKVKPNYFSVFNQAVRTTGSAEAFNGKLNKKFRTHGSFFNFVENLQNEELTKCDEFSRHISGHLQPDRRKPFYLQRAELIEKISHKLQSSEINYKYFLNVLSNEDNNVFYDEEQMFTDQLDIKMSLESELIEGDEKVVEFLGELETDAIVRNVQKETNDGQLSAKRTRSKADKAETMVLDDEAPTAKRTRSKSKTDKAEMVDAVKGKPNKIVRSRLSK